MAVRRIIKMSADSLPGRLREWLKPYAGRNLFNPSVYADGHTLHVAFRAYRDDKQSKPFNAYYANCDPTADPLDELNILDLTEVAAKYGVAPVADPKLFGFAGKVFATFNTGFLEDGENEIYLMQVSPEVGVPQRCILDQRHRIEKNWGFYERGGELRSVYSLNPLIRLKLETGTPGDKGSLHFSREQSDMGRTVHFSGHRLGLFGRRNLSIGTQPLVSDAGLLLMAHEKVYLSKWCGYVGRIVKIDDTSSAPAVDVLRDRFIHSFRRAAPRSGKHNRMVLFVTYFAGLTTFGGQTLVSYGINDTDFGFAQLPSDLIRTGHETCLARIKPQSGIRSTS